MSASGLTDMSKTRRTDRADAGKGIGEWARARDHVLQADLVAMLDDGFGEEAEGEDMFDAVAGLCGMVEVATGHRPEGTPSTPEVLCWEGWILGQSSGESSAALSPGIAARSRESRSELNSDAVRGLCEAALGQRLRSIVGDDLMSAEHPNYATHSLVTLLPGVSLAEVERAFDRAAGGELRARNGAPAKFRAAFSSAGLAINSFAPFAADPSQLRLDRLGGFTGVEFERVFPNGLPGTDPHLDVFCGGSQAVAVEWKSLEYLRPKSAIAFSPAYREIASDFAPTWRSVFERVSEHPASFGPVDAAQLVKHYSGLRRLAPNSISLLYLFWEPLDAPEFESFRAHREGAEALATCLEAGPIPLRVASYEEFWTSLEADASEALANAHSAVTPALHRSHP